MISTYNNLKNQLYINAILVVPFSCSSSGHDSHVLRLDKELFRLKLVVLGCQNRTVEEKVHDRIMAILHSQEYGGLIILVAMIQIKTPPDTALGNIEMPVLGC